MGVFDKFREIFSSDDEDAKEEGYVELDSEGEKKPVKLTVRPYVLTDFEGIKPILDDLREGHTIALVNMRPLKDKDLIELKRAINRLKKTTDAIDGEIAGFGDDFVVATPSSAQIYKAKDLKKSRDSGLETGGMQEKVEKY